MVNPGSHGKAASPPWISTFKLVGAVVVDFDVFPTNREGKLSGDQAVSKKWKKKGGTQLECKVVLDSHTDCKTARLTIDGVDFSDLEQSVTFHEEPSLAKIPPRDLENRYGSKYDLKVPWATDESAA